ncbi:hypothetical protein [Halorarum salinum]|uniref:Preprotein translocase subunit SecD n=1 Tax=Halorarum salinum TaxID=2743089 RepID=A0A7D5Q9J7_9EURY|nr:hypothetical protein [Halobaculum salinum]QLG60998.1 hypothetical protein HUG12_04300 [Halobaculum salinum]
MQPSRRSVLGSLGSSALVGIAGCTSGTATSGTPTDGYRRVDESDGAGVVARLHGPDGAQLLFDERDLREVGPVEELNGSHSIRTRLTDEGASSVVETVRRAGVDGDPHAFEISVEFDGEDLNRFGITAGLAEAIAEGDWDGEFLLLFDGRDRAAEVRRALVGTPTE